MDNIILQEKESNGSLWWSEIRPDRRPSDLRAGQTAASPRASASPYCQDQLQGFPDAGLRCEEHSHPPTSPLPAAVLLQLRKCHVPLRNECVSNGFGNSTCIVVVVPQSGQDPGGVHVLHFLVVLKGVSVDIG